MEQDSPTAGPAVGLNRRGALGLLGALGLAGISLAGCGSDDAEADVSTDPSAVTHSATRLSVSPGLPYEQVVKRFEKTVPALPLDQMKAHLAKGQIDAVRDLLANGSKVKMYVFYTLDVTPFMAAAGHPGKARTYLMGNPLIAEKMFAVDPGVMLYAPLRVLIHTDDTGAAHWVMDRPSELFGSFGSPEITATGAQIDATVANLLRAMKFEVPAALLG
jgi:uncharacterized protein (DUF302 family)